MLNKLRFASFYRLLPLVVVAVAAAVLLGWLLKLESLIQIHPTFVPMQFNTALCFLFAGLSYSFSFAQFKKTSLVFGALLLLLGGGTLLQYVLGLNLGIDELFMEAYITTHSPYPGRPALNTSICFVLTGIAILSLELLASHNLRVLVSTAIGAPVIGFGLVAEFGYVTDLAPAIGWGSTSRMAVHTAGCFVLLSTALVIKTFVMAYKYEKTFRKWIFICVTAVALTFLLCLQLALITQHQHAQRKLIDRDVLNQINILERALESKLSLVGSMLVQSLNFAPDQEMRWRKIAEGLVERENGLESIAVNHSAIPEVWRISINTEGEALIPSRLSCVKPNLVIAGHRLCGDIILREQNEAIFRYWGGINNLKGERIDLVFDVNFVKELMDFSQTLKKRHLRVAMWPSSPTDSSVSALPFWGEHTKNSEFTFYDRLLNSRIAGLDFSIKVFSQDTAVFESRNPIQLASSALSMTLLLVLIWLSYVALSLKKRKAQVELLRSRSDSVIATMLDGLVIIDTRGIIIETNQILRKTFGYSDSELEGQPVEVLIDDSLQPQHRNFVQQFIASDEQVFRVMGIGREVYGIHKSGQQIPLSITLNTAVVNNKKLVYASVTDPTEIHQAERKISEINLALVKSEERYNLAIQGAGVGIWDWFDVKGQRVFWSDRFLELLGYAPHELKVSVNTFDEILHPDDKSSTWEAVDKHLNTGAAFDVEYRLRCKNGNYRWFRASGKAQVSIDKKTTRMVGSVEDIHDKKLLEQQKARILEILEHSSDYVVQMDDEDNILYINKVFKSLLEREQSNAQQVKPYSWLNSEGVRTLNEVILPAASKNRIWTGEVSIFTPSHEEIPCTLVYLIHVNPYTKKEYSSAVFRDISQLKSQEEKLKKSNKELEQFAFIASHDLKEPVRTLSTFASFLIDNLEKNNIERVKEDVNYIQASCLRMTALIEGLLELSRTGQRDLNPSKFFLKDALSEVLKRLSAQIEENSADIEVECGDIELQADYVMIGLAVQNLISNAVKFHKPDEAPKIEVKCVLNEGGDEVSISVSDNGIGIAEEDYAKIFGVFKKLHSRAEYPGTGIGLAIVDKIVARHGGKIHLDSTVGKGARFELVLPRVLESEL